MRNPSDIECRWSRTHALLIDMLGGVRLNLAEASVLSKDDPDVAHYVALLRQTRDSLELAVEALAVRSTHDVMHAMSEVIDAVERAMLVGAIWQLEDPQVERLIETMAQEEAS
ncbi:MAG: hypothetical protein WCG47_29450 [Dermatophilaceae bacterium]